MSGVQKLGSRDWKRVETPCHLDPFEVTPTLLHQKSFDPNLTEEIEDESIAGADRVGITYVAQRTTP